MGINKLLAILTYSLVFTLSTLICNKSQGAESEASLRIEYGKIQATAKKLAGEPQDIGQRVVFLHQIYRDSKGGHVFPQVALHGALWAHGYFKKTGPLGEAISYRYFYNETERQYRHQMLLTLATDFQRANRQVFIDTYTNYYFTKKYGNEPEIKKILRPELVEALNKVHIAAKTGAALDKRSRAETYSTALLWEQENSVSPMVQAALSKIDCPVLLPLSLKPVVQFSYFPRSAVFFFSDFSSKEERIEKATEAYQIAEKVGWSKVIDAMESYGVLPAEFFKNREEFTRSLYLQLTR